MYNVHLLHRLHTTHSAAYPAANAPHDAGYSKRREFDAAFVIDGEGVITTSTRAVRHSSTTSCSRIGANDSAEASIFTA